MIMIKQIDNKIKITRKDYLLYFKNKQSLNQLDMEIDTFQYPINDQLTKINQKANRIGKIRHNLPQEYCVQQMSDISLSQKQICVHCGRIVSDCPEYRQFQDESDIENRFGVYGPNSVIYLGFIKRIVAFKFICVFVFAIPLIVINLSGSRCANPNACKTNDVVFKWSVYNVLGSIQPSSLPNTVLWFIFCLAMVFFTLYLRKYVIETCWKINAKNTTDSDYCLLLRRLPNETTKQDIKLLIQRIYQENHKIQINDKVPNLIRDIIMINQTDKMMKAQAESLKQFKKLIRKDQYQNFVPPQLPRPSKFANAAIVRFYEKTAKDIIMKSTHSNLKQRFMSYLCVFYNARTQYKINNKQISIEYAPHPTDIKWTNFGFSQRSRVIRKIVLNVIAFLILCVSSGISLGISVWIQYLTGNQDHYPLYLTVLVVLITLLFNLLIRLLVLKFTNYMRLDTQTDLQCQRISLVVVHQALNLGFFSIIAPIIVKLPQFIKQETNQSSSFPVVMLTTILIKATVVNIFHFLVDFFQVKKFIYKFLNKNKCKPRTQTEAYAKFKGTQVPFVSGYAFNVKLVWFGFLYGVVTPISILISAVGMLLFYSFQKILFNRVYSIPIYGGPRINYQMIQLLDCTPLIIGCFNLFLYFTAQRFYSFQTDSKIIVLIALMIIIGIAHLMIPWRKIMKKRLNQDLKKEKNYFFNPNHLQITYQQINPETRTTENTIYRQETFLQLQSYSNFIGKKKRNQTLPRTENQETNSRVIQVTNKNLS